MGRDDPELDLGVDILAQVNLDGVEAQVLERSLDVDVFGLDREALGLERSGNLVGVDRAVEMALLVGIGLDGQPPLRDLGAQVLKVGTTGFLELPEPLAVFLDDSQVVRRGESCQPLGEQVIACVTGPDLDKLAGLTEAGHTLGQQHADVSVVSAQGVVLAALDSRLAGGAGCNLLGPSCRAGTGASLGGCLYLRCCRGGRLGRLIRLGTCRLGHGKATFSDLEPKNGQPSAVASGSRFQFQEQFVSRKENHIKPGLSGPAKWFICAPGAGSSPLAHRTAHVRQNGISSSSCSSGSAEGRLRGAGLGGAG